MNIEKMKKELENLPLESLEELREMVIGLSYLTCKVRTLLASSPSDKYFPILTEYFKELSFNNIEIEIYEILLKQGLGK